MRRARDPYVSPLQTMPDSDACRQWLKRALQAVDTAPEILRKPRYFFELQFDQTGRARSKREGHPMRLELPTQISRSYSIALQLGGWPPHNQKHGSPPRPRVGVGISNARSTSHVTSTNATRGSHDRQARIHSTWLVSIIYEADMSKTSRTESRGLSMRSVVIRSIACAVAAVGAIGPLQRLLGRWLRQQCLPRLTKGDEQCSNYSLFQPLSSCQLGDADRADGDNLRELPFDFRLGPTDLQRCLRHLQH